MSAAERDALVVWCPYCAAAPARSCQCRSGNNLPGADRAPHADRYRVARGELPEVRAAEPTLEEIMLSSQAHRQRIEDRTRLRTLAREFLGDELSEAVAAALGPPANVGQLDTGKVHLYLGARERTFCGLQRSTPGAIDHGHKALWLDSADAPYPEHFCKRCVGALA